MLLSSPFGIFSIPISQRYIMVSLNVLQFYLAHSFKLFPCSHLNKKPLTPHGFKDASNDHDTIAKWHAQHPDCAWGTPTSSEYAVVDIDPRNGGNETWAGLIAEHDELPPNTPCVETGSGGRHYIIRFPEGTRCTKLADGIDLKADRGYVIIPPSRILEPHHFQPYKWLVKPWEYPVKDAPEWLKGENPNQRQAANLTTALDSYTLETHPGSAFGQRRVALCNLVGRALGSGSHPETVRQQAEAWAGRCEPPFEDWQKHVAGLVRREDGKPNNISSASSLTAPALRNPRKELTNSLDTQAEVSSFRGVSSERKPEANPQAIDIQTVRELVPSEKGLVSSFQAVAETVKDETGMVDGEDVVQLSADAYHGVIGNILRAIEPETEAHPAGVLVATLTLIGNAIGSGAWVKVGPRKHHPAIYSGICSKTSGGKGDAYAVARYLIGKCDLPYCVNAIAQGVGSGEGLIERVRDELSTIGKKGEPVTIPGSLEKRCLLRLPELSRAFRVGRRDSSTLSEILREAWDGEPIHIPNRGGNALIATGYSIGVVGDITPGALAKLLLQGTEAIDGYANRFLWVNTERVRMLPFGGDITKADTLIPILNANLDKGKGVGEVVLDDPAKELWIKVYPDLLASADTVPHTDRARPYALRLALIYALADGEKVIGERHLRAGLAVWEYCRQSAASLFGSAVPPTLDPLWLTLLNAITMNPGVSRTELIRAVRQKADAIGDGLSALRQKGLAYPVLIQNPNGGPRKECWYPGREEPNNNSSVSPFTLPVSPDGGKELTNSLPFRLVVEPEGTNSPGTNCWEGTNSPEPDRELVSSFRGVAEKVKSGAGETSEKNVVQQEANKFIQEVYAYWGRIEKLPDGQLRTSNLKLDHAERLNDPQFREAVAQELLTEAEFEQAFGVS
jgi:hypothetical protein